MKQWSFDVRSWGPNRATPWKRVTSKHGRNISYGKGLKTLPGTMPIFYSSHFRSGKVNIQFLALIYIAQSFDLCKFYDDLFVIVSVEQL